MTIDMSPEAVTNRMIALDELWELAVALKSSKIVEDESFPQSDTPPQTPQNEMRDG